MKILTRLSFLIFAVCIFYGCGAKSQVSQNDKKNYDYLEYNFPMKDLTGNLTSLAEFKDKVIFLNIWATWCPPCRKEMPSIQNLKNRIQHPDVKFVLVSPEDPAKIKQFLQTNDLNLPVYTISNELPPVLRDEYIPRTYIIDRYGRIVRRHVGESNWNTQEIYDFITFLASTKVKS